MIVTLEVLPYLHENFEVAKLRRIREEGKWWIFGTFICPGIFIYHHLLVENGINEGVCDNFTFFIVTFFFYCLNHW